jgi:Flp pilus assembly protein TadB
MVTRVVALATVVFFCGATLVLGELHWFRRRPLSERLAPYVSGEGARRSQDPVVTWATWREALAPLARRIGDRAARLTGVTEPDEVRLERLHWPCTMAELRLRQLGWVAGGFGAGTIVSVGLGLPGPLALGFVLGAPLLAFLVVEQRLANQSRSWQRQVFLELPVVAEQLGMLLAAGFSLGAAVNRLAERGSGACSRDLARVATRMRVGLTEDQALGEWSALAGVPAVERLVGVLALNRHAGDLGRLISEEARSVRRDVHRELMETIERRSQQVWVPVTLAALVPGVIFLAVPFVEALQMYSNA